jgi:hypothetical protein
LLAERSGAAILLISASWKNPILATGLMIYRGKLWASEAKCGYQTLGLMMAGTHAISCRGFFSWPTTLVKKRPNRESLLTITGPTVLSILLA